MHNLKIVLVQIRDLNISGNCAKFKNIFSHLIRLLIYFFPGTPGTDFSIHKFDYDIQFS